MSEVIAPLQRQAGTTRFGQISSRRSEGLPLRDSFFFCMNTCGARRGLLLTWILWLFNLALSNPAAGDTLQPCTYQLSTLPQAVAEALDRLRHDAFADAYETYARDLEQVEDDFHEWVDEVEEYLRTECQPYEEARQIYEQDRANFESGCASVSEDQLNECLYQKSQLDLRREVLLRRGEKLNAIQEGFDQRSQTLTTTAATDIEHARLVLQPEHVEDALRLFISRIQKQHSGNSCHDLALIAEKLGERVVNQWYFLEFLARNLVSRPRQLSYLIREATLTPFEFDATGFQPRFRTDLGDNQVRHAVAYMVVGYKFQGSGADLVAQIRDELKGEPQDYWLGVEAGHMGFQLRTGIYGTRNFGRAIRARLCL